MNINFRTITGIIAVCTTLALFYRKFIINPQAPSIPFPKQTPSASANLHNTSAVHLPTSTPVLNKISKNVCTGQLTPVVSPVTPQAISATAKSALPAVPSSPSIRMPFLTPSTALPLTAALAVLSSDKPHEVSETALDAFIQRLKADSSTVTEGLQLLLSPAVYREKSVVLFGDALSTFFRIKILLKEFPLIEKAVKTLLLSIALAPKDTVKARFSTVCLALRHLQWEEAHPELFCLAFAQEPQLLTSIVDKLVENPTNAAAVFKEFLPKERLKTLEAEKIKTLLNKFLTGIDAAVQRQFTDWFYVLDPMMTRTSNLEQDLIHCKYKKLLSKFLKVAVKIKSAELAKFLTVTKGEPLLLLRTLPLVEDSVAKLNKILVHPEVRQTLRDLPSYAGERVLTNLLSIKDRNNLIRVCKIANQGHTQILFFRFEESEFSFVLEIFEKHPSAIPALTNLLRAMVDKGNKEVEDSDDDDDDIEEDNKIQINPDREYRVPEVEELQELYNADPALLVTLLKITNRSPHALSVLLEQKPLEQAIRKLLTVVPRELSEKVNGQLMKLLDVNEIDLVEGLIALFGHKANWAVNLLDIAASGQMSLVKKILCQIKNPAESTPALIALMAEKGRSTNVKLLQQLFILQEAAAKKSPLATILLERVSLEFSKDSLSPFMQHALGAFEEGETATLEAVLRIESGHATGMTQKQIAMIKKAADEGNFAFIQKCLLNPSPLIKELLDKVDSLDVLEGLSSALLVLAKEQKSETEIRDVLLLGVRLSTLPGFSIGKFLLATCRFSSTLLQLQRESSTPTEKLEAINKALNLKEELSSAYRNYYESLHAGGDKTLAAKKEVASQALFSAHWISQLLVPVEGVFTVGLVDELLPLIKECTPPYAQERMERMLRNLKQNPSLRALISKAQGTVTPGSGQLQKLHKLPADQNLTALQVQQTIVSALLYPLRQNKWLVCNYLMILIPVQEEQPKRTVRDLIAIAETGKLSRTVKGVTTEYPTPIYPASKQLSTHPLLDAWVLTVAQMGGAAYAEAANHHTFPLFSKKMQDLAEKLATEQQEPRYYNAAKELALHFTNELRSLRLDHNIVTHKKTLLQQTSSGQWEPLNSSLDYKVVLLDFLVKASQKLPEAPKKDPHWSSLIEGCLDYLASDAWTREWIAKIDTSLDSKKSVDKALNTPWSFTVDPGRLPNVLQTYFEKEEPLLHEKVYGSTSLFTDFMEVLQRAPTVFQERRTPAFTSGHAISLLPSKELLSRFQNLGEIKKEKAKFLEAIKADPQFASLISKLYKEECNITNEAELKSLVDAALRSADPLKTVQEALSLLSSDKTEKILVKLLIFIHKKAFAEQLRKPKAEQRLPIGIADHNWLNATGNCDILGFWEFSTLSDKLPLCNIDAIFETGTSQAIAIPALDEELDESEDLDDVEDWNDSEEPYELFFINESEDIPQFKKSLQKAPIAVRSHL